MRPRDAVSISSGIAALAVSIFAIGGAPRWAQALAAALTGIALIPQLTSRRTFERVSPLVVMLGIACGLTALQLVPLPHGLRAWLDPVGTALRDDGASLVGTSPWQAITHDPAGTLRALSYFLTLLGIAVLALRFASSERGRYRILATVALLCGGVVLVVAIHTLFGVKQLYGLYEPMQAGPHLLGPLLNLNHLACLTTVGALISVALAWHRAQRGWLRAVWLVIAIGCAMITLQSVSRGATLSLGAGALITVGLLIAQPMMTGTDLLKRHRAHMLTSTVPIAVVALSTALVIVYVSAGNVGDQLAHTSFAEIESSRGKFAAWHSALGLIEESPWVGVGRGAFEPTFTRVHPASAYTTFSHVENEYVQAVVDWGVPGALLVGIAAAWLVTRALRRWRDGALAAGAIGALVAVLLQSNVDFGLELLGVAAPLTAVIATLVPAPLRETNRLALARGLRAAHALALLVCAALLTSTVTRSVAEDHVVMQELRTPTLAQLNDSLERHPLDYFGYAKAAEVMIRDKDQRGIRVLNHALALFPTHSGLHLVAARLLADSGHADQAAIEFSAAMRAARDPRKLLAEIMTRLPPALAATAIPTDELTVDSLEATLEELGHGDVTVAWLGRVLDTHPNHLHACELLYTIAIRRDSLDVFNTTRKRCPTYEPTHQARMQLAQLLLEQQAYTDVARLLEDVETWHGLVEERATAWLQLCDAQVGLALWDEAKRCLRRLDASGALPTERASEIASRFEHIQQLRTAADAKPH